MNKYKNKKILIIGAGDAQVHGILKAIEMGCYVYAIDGNQNAAGFKYAHECKAINFAHIPDVINYVKQNPVSAVVAFSCDAAISAVSALVEEFGLHGLNRQDAQVATNKYKVRTICKEAGIPSPLFSACDHLVECQSDCERIGYPCVIKPIDSSGSRGVSFVSRKSDIPNAFNRAKRFSNSGVVLVEEFLNGLEISVEGFVTKDSVEVITLSDKIRTKPPYLLDQEVIFPTQYQGEDLHSIKALAYQVMKALDVSPTPFHMEVLMTSEGPRLVEVGLRGPGFKVFSEIIPQVTGVDVLGATVDLAFGNPICINIKANRAGMIRFFAGKEGVLKSINGVDQARRVDGVSEVEFYVKPNQRTYHLRSGDDRLGHMICYADTREKVIESCNNAFKKIELVYE